MYTSSELKVNTHLAGKTNLMLYLIGMFLDLEVVLGWIRIFVYLGMFINDLISVAVICYL